MKIEHIKYADNEVRIPIAENYKDCMTLIKTMNSVYVEKSDHQPQS